MVSLMLFCRMGTGTHFCGSAERKTRNSGCAPSSRASSFFSSLGSQPATSSMLASMTQPPSMYIWSSAFSATTSWPWPRLTRMNLPSSSVLPRPLPSTLTSASGLTPGESRKKMGTAGPLSSKESARSKLIAVMYCAPSTSPTHRMMASVMRSGRSARMIMSCRKPESRFHSCGSGCDSGCSCSHHSFQRFQLPSMSAGSVAKSSITARACTLPQQGSGSQAGCGFSFSLLRGFWMSMSRSSIDSSGSPLSSSRPRQTLIASCVEKMMRCRSKRPRVTKAKTV